MKRVLLIVVATIALAVVGNAQSSQKYAYIYSQEIFKDMPEYKTAVKDLDRYVTEVEEQAKSKLETVKGLFEEYLKVENSLSESAKQLKKAEIVRLEKEANEFQESLYGEEGLIKKMQTQLMKPIEDKVMNAINKIAQDGGYDMIFDLSIVKVTVFQSPKLNLTNAVRAQLGLAAITK